MSIRRLPWEIISYIAQELDLDDLFNLSLSCRQLQGLIHDENVCRRALESRAPWAAETQSARQTRQFSRELRKLVKRRTAISTATPYSAAVVAEAESYIYSDGVLCYIRDGRLRILDLHNSAALEQVVSIAHVLDSDSRLVGWRKLPPDQVQFRLVHYSHNILTCRFSRRKSQPGRLVVIDLARCRVSSHRLESAEKLFVRNNADFLFYGTYSEESQEHDDLCWAVHSYNLRDDLWYGRKFTLFNLVGSEIDVNICFEILNGQLYCLANRASFEIEEIAWKSYYTYVRIPLGEPDAKGTDDLASEVVWRKNHNEGPIDDRWTFLRLVKNEGSGTLTIIESRKEWRSGNSTSIRTYYTSELKEPEKGDRADVCSLDDNGLDLQPAGSSSQASTSTPSVQAVASSSAPTGPKDDDNNINSRPYSTVHPGDDSSSSMSMLSRSLIRSYHPSSQAFMDLVLDDAPPTESIYANSNLYMIRLRAGSRRLRTAQEVEELGDAYANLPDNPLYPEKEIKTLYKTSEVSYWPPDQLEGGQSDPELENLYGILNPGTQHGPVWGKWDERSLCYAAETADKGLSAIVFISFDPSIRLRGIRSWQKRGGALDNHSQGCEAGRDGGLGDLSTVLGTADAGTWADTPGSNQMPTAVAASSKGKQRAGGEEPPVSRATWLSNANDRFPAAAALAVAAAAEGPAHGNRAGPAAADSGTSLASKSSIPMPEWSRREPPMYSVIQRGYDFAYR